MGNKSRQKGNRAEAEVVALHKAIGIQAQRVPLSGAAGGLFKGDVIIDGRRAEVKSRANGQGFVTLEKWLADNDLLFLRRDRQKPLVLMPWAVYEKLILSQLEK